MTDTFAVGARSVVLPIAPMVATAAVTSSRTVRSVSRNGCSRRQTSAYHLLNWPSTI